MECVLEEVALVSRVKAFLLHGIVEALFLLCERENVGAEGVTDGAAEGAKEGLPTLVARRGSRGLGKSLGGRASGHLSLRGLNGLSCLSGGVVHLSLKSARNTIGIRETPK